MPAGLTAKRSNRAQDLRNASSFATLGANKSALHWDLVKDLRFEGTITLDGHPVYEAGRFLID